MSSTSQPLRAAAWGWNRIVLGCVQIVAALGVFVGSRGARISGIVPACLTPLGRYMFQAAFLFWSVATMLLSVLVIYALLREPHHVTGVGV